MRRAEREAFEHFLRAIRTNMGALDGCVPVALVSLPVDAVHADGAIDVQKDGQARLLWVAGFPMADRAPLLKSISEGYHDPRAVLGT